MRYIKRYSEVLYESNLFVTADDLKEFRDIFQELEDVGFEVYRRTKLDPILNHKEGLYVKRSEKFIECDKDLFFLVNISAADARRYLMGVKKYSKQESINVLIVKQNGFPFSEIKETVEFAKSYCSEFGYKLNYICFFDETFKYTKDIDLVIDDVGTIELSFMKV